jgi:hypothetical protein
MGGNNHPSLEICSLAFNSPIDYHCDGTNHCYWLDQIRFRFSLYGNVISEKGTFISGLQPLL